MMIETYGRTDLADLFSKSGILESKKLNHYPFLVFTTRSYNNLDIGVRVNVVNNSRDLLKNYPDETPVMVQWRGHWKSDFFKFRVGDLRSYLRMKP